MSTYGTYWVDSKRANWAKISDEIKPRQLVTIGSIFRTVEIISVHRTIKAAAKECHRLGTVGQMQQALDEQLQTA